MKHEKPRWLEVWESRSTPDRFSPDSTGDHRAPKAGSTLRLEDYLD